MSKHACAVYGTLRRGQRNHYRLDNPGALYIGMGVLKGYRMMNLGGCPGVRPDPKGEVVAELFHVDDAVLASLDRLESHPDVYTRTPCVFTDEGGAEHPTQVYVYNRDGYDDIEGGDWVEHMEARRVALGL